MAVFSFKSLASRQWIEWTRDREKKKHKKKVFHCSPFIIHQVSLPYVHSTIVDRVCSIFSFSFRWRMLEFILTNLFFSATVKFHSFFFADSFQYCFMPFLFPPAFFFFSDGNAKSRWMFHQHLATVRCKMMWTENDDGEMVKGTQYTYDYKLSEEKKKNKKKIISNFRSKID